MNCLREPDGKALWARFSPQARLGLWATVEKPALD